MTSSSSSSSSSSSKKRMRPTTLTSFFGKQGLDQKKPTRVLIQVVDRRTRGSQQPIVTKH
jgi:hypothetical protein